MDPESTIPVSVTVRTGAKVHKCGKAIVPITVIVGRNTESLSQFIPEWIMNLLSTERVPKQDEEQRLSDYAQDIAHRHDPSLEDTLREIDRKTPLQLCRNYRLQLAGRY